MSAEAPAWSSQFAVYLGTIGAAVGLGSIWRFPYLAGSGGGSAFIFVFVLACVLIAMPLLTAEFLIGRHTHLDPARAPGALARECGLSPRWGAIGALGTLSAFLIISYYTVIAGWVLAYTWKCASGELTGLQRPQVERLWHSFLASPWQLGAWHLAFLSLVTFISARGLAKGIELASKIRAPVMLVLMLALVLYSLVTGETARGLDFAFSPKFSAITPQVVLAAIGQAFYATGVGMAVMLAYGSYMQRGTSLVRSSLVVVGSILLASLLSTLIIFPLVFRYGMNPAKGPELAFLVLPTAFAEMPGGRLVGGMFFLLLVFAALTPSLGLLEPVVVWVQQRFSVTRGRAAVLSALAVWIAGVASVFSFNVWKDWKPLGGVPGFATMSFFDLADYISGNIFLPVGAFLTSLFIGWRLSRVLIADQLSEETPRSRLLCVMLLRYVCPLAIAGVFVTALL